MFLNIDWWCMAWTQINFSDDASYRSLSNFANRGWIQNYLILFMTYVLCVWCFKYIVFDCYLYTQDINMLADIYMLYIFSLLFWHGGQIKWCCFLMCDDWRLEYWWRALFIVEIRHWELFSYNFKSRWFNMFRLCDVMRWWRVLMQ